MAFYSRTAVKSLEELELSTLTNLYTSGKLDASITQTAISPPSATFNDQVILVQMDMTRMAIDAIVNAANKSLLGGGGIDGAIHRAAGRGLYAECVGLDGCETGQAKITKGYNLPAKHVIHTVGPIYWDYKDAGLDPAGFLKSCYVQSLDVARRNGCKTVAFPCISTGIYGYPNDRAAVVACQAVREYLEAQLEETLSGADEDETAEEAAEGKEEKTDVTGKEEGDDVKEEEKDAKPAEADEKVAEDEQKETRETKDENSEDKSVGEEEGSKPAEKEADPPFISKIEKVIFCVFLDKDLTIYEDILPSFFPPADPEVEGAIDKLDREASEKPEGSSDPPVDEQPKDTPGE